VKNKLKLISFEIKSMQKPCVFCGIASKAIPSKIVYEDDFSIAFLDINPRSRGMTIVAPKQHYKEFNENFELTFKVFESAIIVAEMLKQALEPKSVSMSIIESPEVPHFHIRLYPVYEDQIPLVENKSIPTNDIELENIAERIRGVKIEIRKREEPEKVVKKEEIKEKPRSKEEINWLKRSMQIG